MSSSSSATHIRSWLQEQSPKQLALLDKLETDYLRRNINVSKAADSTEKEDRVLVIIRFVELIRNMIGSTKCKTGGELLLLLKSLGKELSFAGGYREPAIGIAVRRIMCAVRDEVMCEREEEKEEKRNNKNSASCSTSMPFFETQNRHSLTSMLYAHPQYLVKKTTNPSMKKKSTTTYNVIEYENNLPEPFHKVRSDLKSAIMEAIQEIISDLEDTHKNINDQAYNSIHSAEVILCYGHSDTIESFLKAASSKGDRTFHVIICESAPYYDGHLMAKNLSSFSSFINTTIIHDTAVFAVMSRVNKVLLPAHAVLANGGLVTKSGANLVALAAKHHSVPVVVVTGMFKLCHMYPHEGQDTLQDLKSPCRVISYQEAVPDVEFINPLHDYIPPSLIHFYVTNVGGFQPSYIYRLLSEYYHVDDWDSFEEE